MTTVANVNEIRNLEEVLQRVDLPENIPMKVAKGCPSKKNADLFGKQKRGQKSNHSKTNRLSATVCNGLKPYQSWECYLNENHNGLFRQFFPKKMPLHKVTEKELFKATDLMNNRPRKCLGYKTPWEIFSHAMGIDHNINPSVALMA